MPMAPEGYGFYWAHCDGPDGHVVLLVKYGRFGFNLIEDADRLAQLEDGRLHKWRVHMFTRVVRPQWGVES